MIDLRRVTITAIIAAIFFSGLQLYFFSPALNAQGIKTKLTTQGLAQDPFLAETLYSVPKRMAGNIGDDGAIGVNCQIRQGKRLYIEEQRYGGDLIQAGLAIGDDSLVRLGLRVIDWGFRQQAKDGSFPQSGDAFHSVSMFVEGAARGFLSLRETKDNQYADVVTEMMPRLLASVHWLEQTAAERKGIANDAPYTHRRWILAAALGQTAILTHDTYMTLRAKIYAEDGLSLQLSNGINPEKGGYDVSYQAVGILFAERYFVVCPDNKLQARIKKMIQQASNWELTMITKDGQVLIGDSTRVENEKSRSGKIKHVNIKELLQALSFATTITGDKKYREKAVLIARTHNWY